jgi:hypothetical protein
MTRKRLAFFTGVAGLAAVAATAFVPRPAERPIAATVAPAKPRLFIASALEIYRISAAGGAIEKFEAKLDPTLDLGQMPVASRDDAVFAYTEANEIAVVNAATKRSVRLTSLGVAADDEWAAVEAVPLAFSGDTKRLLFELTNGDRVNEHGHDRKTREAPYGFYVLDVASGKTTRLAGNGDFLSWLPDESVIALPREKSATGWVPVRLAGGRADPLVTGGELRGRFVRQQVDATPDGRLWLASIADASDELRTRVIAVDVVARTVRTIVPLGEVGVAHQFPRLSPSGAHASLVVQDYRGHDEKSAAPPPSALMVDGKRVYPAEGAAPLLIANAMWLDEEALAVALADQIIVLDWRTGHVRASTTRSVPQL